MIGRFLDIGGSLASTVLRFGFAERVGGAGGARPHKPLELYEFEGCPFCRKVREALTVLDLGAKIHPCPKGGPRYRPWVLRRGGKEQFPYLVDPNTGSEMYESDEIIRYLFSHYGNGNVPLLLRAPILGDANVVLANAVRIGRGARYRRSRAPELPLELYSYEGSPFCRIVRERLSEREIPYLLHNVAHGSAHRASFTRRSGRMQVPYLVDPNTGIAMFESADILCYLDQTYGDSSL